MRPIDDLARGIWRRLRAPEAKLLASYLDFVPIAAPVRAFELTDPTKDWAWDLMQTGPSMRGSWRFQAELAMELSSHGELHMSLPHSYADLRDVLEPNCRSLQVRTACPPYPAPAKRLYCTYVVGYRGDATQLDALLKRYEWRHCPVNVGVRYFVTGANRPVNFEDLAAWDAPFDVASPENRGGRDQSLVALERWEAVFTALWANEGRLARILRSAYAVVLPTYNDSSFRIVILTLDPHWRDVASALYRLCQRWGVPCRDLAGDQAQSEGDT